MTIENNKRCILRISENEHYFKNNCLALNKLNKLKEVPNLISFGKMVDFYYSIETFLYGRKRSISKKNLTLLIESIGKIHKVHNEKSGLLGNNSDKWKDYFFENHIDRYKKRFRLKVKDWEKYFRLAKEKFPKKTGPFSLLHGDFCFKNSLFNGGDVGFFDFEDSFWGEKEYDLGMIYFIELLPKNDFLDILSSWNYNKDKILFYSFCIGIRKVALARNDKHVKDGLKKLNIIYKRIANNPQNK